MPASNICRLCRKTCSNSVSLRDTTNSCSEVYYITIKFFHPSFLDVEKGSPNPTAVLCMECWQYISSFNNYQQSILLLQANLIKDVNNIQKSSDIDIIDLDDDEDNDCIVTPAKNTGELENVPDNPSSSGFNSGKLIITDCEIKFEADVEHVIDTNSRAVDTRTFTETNDLSLQEDYSQTNDIRVENEAWDIESVGSMDNSDSYQPLETKSTESTSDSSFNFNRRNTKNKKSNAPDAVIAKWRPILECRLCPKTSTTFLDLRKHFHTEHPKDEFYIACCNSHLKHRFRAEEHAIYHLDPTANKCSICGKCFTTRGRLKTHLQSVHFSSGRVTAKAPALEAPPISSIYLRDIQCKYCRNLFEDRAELNQHILDKHSETKVNYTTSCSICSLTFTYRSGLYHHQQRHHPEEFAKRRTRKRTILQRHSNL